MVHLALVAAENCTNSLHRSPVIPSSQCVCHCFWFLALYKLLFCKSYVSSGIAVAISWSSETKVSLLVMVQQSFHSLCFHSQDHHC